MARFILIIYLTWHFILIGGEIWNDIFATNYSWENGFTAWISFSCLSQNVLLKCEKLKENMSWCEAWRKTWNLFLFRFSFDMVALVIIMVCVWGLCLEYMKYQRVFFKFAFAQSFIQIKWPTNFLVACTSFIIKKNWNKN